VIAAGLEGLLINVEGKVVYTEVAELVTPSHAALLIVDMQRDYVEAGGALDQLGVDLSMYPPMRPRLAGLLAAARRTGVAVVHIQMTTLADRKSDSPAQIRFNLRMHAGARAGGPPLRYAVSGTPGHEFIEELRPREGEFVVQKWRSSGFWGTNLDLLLRSNGIKTVVMSGCTTEGCVESTARDAMFNDYYVVVAEDCVASDDPAQHDASILLMRHRFDLASSHQIAEAWSQSLPRDGRAEHSDRQLSGIISMPPRAVTRPARNG
jgi:nicotinamidase-related amidase